MFVAYRSPARGASSIRFMNAYRMKHASSLGKSKKATGTRFWASTVCHSLSLTTGNVFFSDSDFPEELIYESCEDGSVGEMERLPIADKRLVVISLLSSLS